MASRFETVDEECIEQLKDKSEMKTRRIARSGERTFSKKWANERNLQANLEEYENDVLDQGLSQF